MPVKLSSTKPFFHDETLHKQYLAKYLYAWRARGVTVDTDDGFDKGQTVSSDSYSSMINV